MATMVVLFCFQTVYPRSHGLRLRAAESYQPLVAQHCWPCSHSSAACFYSLTYASHELREPLEQVDEDPPCRLRLTAPGCRQLETSLLRKTPPLAEKAAPPAADMLHTCGTLSAMVEVTPCRQRYASSSDQHQTPNVSFSSSPAEPRARLELPQCESCTGRPCPRTRC